MKSSDPPTYFNFAEDVLGHCATNCPDATALLHVDEQGHETPWTFGAMAEQSSRLAHVLRDNGLTRGDVVPLLVPSLPFGVIARLAVMKAGGVSLLLRQGTAAREITHYVERAGPHLVIAGPGEAERFPPPLRVLTLPSPELTQDLAGAPAHFTSLRLRSEEPEHIVLTGGTTGLPKMVVHTHGSRAFHYLRWTITFEADDLSWDLAGRWWLGAWRYGTPVFDRVAPAGTTADFVRETLTRYPITRLMAPARLYSELLRQGPAALAFPRLRMWCSAGQALDPAVARAWNAATGMRIYDRYGQSECADSPFELPDEAAYERGCIGKPFPWVNMAVIDPDGRPLPAGALGEIAIKAQPIRPPWLFREYLGDPDATAARHRGDWYLTGDSGHMDQDGFYYLAGRVDDVINCGGTNIGPWELESVLLEHPAVHEVAVVGVPHKDLGEVPKAFVVAERGFTPTPQLADELLAFVNGAIHSHKWLREVEFTATLPSTPEGKLRRAGLRTPGTATGSVTV
jgi:acyl-coenzyme A synthetase/AMP-(fatty) acid ligase